MAQIVSSGLKRSRTKLDWPRMARNGPTLSTTVGEIQNDPAWPGMVAGTPTWPTIGKNGLAWSR
eukprot:7610876-Lingulodinium_polyedra.AAC.1